MTETNVNKGGRHEERQRERESDVNKKGRHEKRETEREREREKGMFCERGRAPKGAPHEIYHKRTTYVKQKQTEKH